MEDRQDERRRLGRRGEDEAARFLVRRGYEIVERGYRALRGEIDIVAKDGDTLVFVEVKTRSDPSQVLPEEGVTPAKQSQVRRIASAYLADRDLGSPFCRFDVVGVEIDDDGPPVVRHLIDAF